MFIISMGLISLGYVILYWGVDNMVSWMGDGKLPTPGETSLSGGTDAVELPILFGFPGYQGAPNKHVHLDLHEVPFPYHPVTKSGELIPVSTTQPPQNPVRSV